MSSPGLRELKKQRTRWAIQEHALRLIAQQGYDATTVEQIAAAAEISPSTFFRYFKTKEDVIIEDEYDPMMVELFASAPLGGSPLATMRQVIRQAFSQMSADDKQKIMERTKLIRSVPALRARSYENLENTILLISEIVGRRLGRPADDFEVRTFAGAFVGALLPIIFIWVESDGAEDVVELMDRALAFLENGLPLTPGTEVTQ
jgi:AcrR family transcriptional regulator